MTLLAFGNGAPDIITGILAARATEEEDEAEQKGIYLSIGGLVGSSFFIITVVLGIIIYTSKTYEIKLVRGQFLKDTIFLAFSSLVFAIYIYVEEVTLPMSVFLLIIYLLYGFIVTLQQQPLDTLLFPS